FGIKLEGADKQQKSASGLFRAGGRIGKSHEDPFCLLDSARGKQNSGKQNQSPADRRIPGPVRNGGDPDASAFFPYEARRGLRKSFFEYAFFLAQKFELKPFRQFKEFPVGA